MSSPASSTRSTNQRVSRRRQRGSEDGASLRQQPVRKRNKLNQDHFTGPAGGLQLNGEVQGTRLMNGHTTSHASNDTSQSIHFSIAQRGSGRTRAPRGVMKEDAARTLTQNAKYAVKHLPALPTQLRSNKTAYLGSQILASGYTLTLTRDAALIWNYTASALSPSAQSLPLPYPAKSEEPIPLGAFVTWGSGSDTGLIVVNTTNGKISFWESIENADTLSLFQQRKYGVEGSCGRLMYGETVTDLQDAESAGFILSFSSGRVAQLLVRDAQSQPSISVTFLRSNNNVHGGGFLGSLKNVFGTSASLRNVAATRTRPSGVRGQMEVVVASAEATFQMWQLSLSSQPVLQKEIDTRSIIENAIAATNMVELNGQRQGLKVVDFAIVPNNITTLSLLLLVSLGAGGNQEYALLRMHIKGDEALISQQMVPLSSYNAPLVPKSIWKPKLCVPNPGSIAFVVFPDAIVLTSLQADQDPDLLDPFQDAIHFREEPEYVTCGATIEVHETRHRDASILVFLQDCGVLRITAAREVPDSEDSERPKVSAKSKIEQAVFFGDQKSNPLNLVHKLAANVDIDEVERAALLISGEILSTTSPCLRALAPSMEYNLEQRAHNLESLALYLQRFYPDISRETKWKLRFDAEKMAAAREIWTTCDRRKRGKGEMRLLDEIIISILEEMKTPVDPQGGEKDETRHFFLKDIDKIYMVIAWGYRQVQDFKDDGDLGDDDYYVELLSEAGDIEINGITAGLEFRYSNAALYGLEEDEAAPSGHLIRGYQGLPEFWTSHPAIWAFMPKQLDVLKGLIEERSQGAGSLADVPPNIQKISKDMVSVTDLFCAMGEEALLLWDAGDEASQAMAKKHQLGYERERRRLLVALATTFVDLGTYAIELAEKYSDMAALVDVIGELSALLTYVENQSNDPEIQAKANKEIMELEQKVRGCCKKHGSSFTNVFYKSQIANGQLNGLLDQAISYPKEVTEFFRSNPETRKIGWINEALFEKNYFRAGRDLLNVAVSHEEDLWNRKVEIAISKLALAAASRNDAPEEELDKNFTAQKEEAQLIRIQETIYDHFRPELYNAVDDDGALQLAMEAFGSEATKGMPRLRELLEHAMAKLVRNKAMDPDQLVDLLTFMDSRSCQVPAYSINGKEALLALEVLKYAGMQQDRLELSLRIVWRRCFLRDTWEDINNTAGKSDEDTTDILESTTLFKTIYEGFARGVWEPSLGVRTMGPKDVDGAGTTAAELMVRFSMVDLCEPIAREMRKDNEKLNKLMRECRLEHWFEVVREAAERRWSTEATAKDTLAHALGTTTQAIYEEDTNLERGEEAEQAAKMAKVPGSWQWQDAEHMGLGSFR